MLLCGVTCIYIFIFIFYSLHCPLSGPDLTYISLLIIPCIIYHVTNKETLTLTRLTYNDKPWYTAKLRQLRQAKEDAYRKGDIVLYKQAKYTLETKIRVVKRNYSDKLRIKFSPSDSA